MSTIRDLLQVVIEEEINNQRALAILRDLQAKYDALKAEHDKCLSSTPKSENV